MARGTDWRSLDFTRMFERFDRTDFAQEFLRRNKTYRKDYAEIAGIIAAYDQQARLAEIADQWGLVFRLRS